MEQGTPPEFDVPRAVEDGAGYARRLIRRIGGRLTAMFACIALPLWVFGELADEVIDGEPFGFDEPALRLMHALSGAEADAVFLAFSAVGYAWGVIPAGVAIPSVLLLRRRFREAAFMAIAMGGAALLNLAAKHSFRRERPALWDSIAPESTYSFPSGHAMGSAALVWALLALAWHTPHRVLALALGIPFVVGVGLSRVYLGVHYPSDILAGWTAAAAWTVGVYFLVFRGAARPWRPQSLGRGVDQYSRP